MHGQVHPGELAVEVGLFLTVEGDVGIDGVLVAHFLDEVPGLHKHACRTACRVKHCAVVGLDHVHDHANQAWRREEFATFLRTTLGELVQKVFVDAPEHIAFGRLQSGAVEDFDEFGQ